MALIGTHAPFQGVFMELQNSLVEESSVVTLKNNTRYSRDTVKLVLDKILGLMATPDPSNEDAIFNGAILLSELVARCQNEEHMFFDGCERKLMQLEFIDTDGVVKPYVRDIVLSSITGHGVDLGFTSPLIS